MKSMNKQTKTSYGEFKEDYTKVLSGCLTLLFIILALIFPLLWIPFAVIYGSLAYKYFSEKKVGEKVDK